MSTCEPGKFIAFEGIDGSGKTSQIPAVAALMRERLKTEVVETQAIGKDGLSGRLRNILLEAQELEVTPAQAVALFIPARLEAQRNFEAARNKGHHILCDRWTLSADVYQTVTQNGHRAPTPEMVEDLNWSLGVRVPDLYVIFRVPPEEAFKRLSDRGMGDRFENGIDALKVYAERYETIPRQLSLGHAPYLRYVYVDGTGPVEEVAERTWQAMQHLFSQS